jgi:hypothetical protein
MRSCVNSASPGIQAMCGSQGLSDKFEELVTNNPNQVNWSDHAEIVATPNQKQTKRFRLD